MPYQTDLDYRRAFNEQLPSTKEELAALETKYCKLIALTCEYFCTSNKWHNLRAASQLPSLLGLLGLKLKRHLKDSSKRLDSLLLTFTLQYFIPDKNSKDIKQCNFVYKPGKFLEHVITNLVHLCINADHARKTKTRKSVSCIIAAIHGVIVHWIPENKPV